jgi:hypothetical protein
MKRHRHYRYRSVFFHGKDFGVRVAEISISIKRGLMTSLDVFLLGAKENREPHRVLRLRHTAAAHGHLLMTYYEVHDSRLWGGLSSNF